jgi:hypothetical protein
MKYLNLVIFIFSLIITHNVGAYIVPDHGHSGGRGEGRGPGRPDPYPGRGEEPGRPDPYPEADLEQRRIPIYRLLANETLSLRQIAGIDRRFDGYVVESVVVQVRRSSLGAQMRLLLDGRPSASSNFINGEVYLTPFSRAKLGRDFFDMHLDVRGWAEVDSITINLRQGRGPIRPAPGNGRYEPALDIPISIYRRTYGHDRIDLSPYLNLQQYRGHQISSIEIEATPVYNSGLIDVMINGFSQEPTLRFDRWNARQEIYPTSAVIGYGAESIVLYTNGELDVKRITLRLTR